MCGRWGEGLPNQMAAQLRIFLSHAGGDRFEAGLLQYAVEHILSHLGATVWSYQRDQDRSEADVAGSLMERIRESDAMIFLATPTTIAASTTQWMELAYAHAFGVPRHVLLHRLRYQDLIAGERAVPPLLIAAQCNDAALEWRDVIDRLGRQYQERGVHGVQSDG